jgi:hypothetical protein
MTIPHSDGWIGHWAPGIGDPTPGGWLTVMLYAVAALQCYRVARATANSPMHRERAFWAMLALGMLALGINKQLDLQTALTEIGRLIAHHQGWYETRHAVQQRFVYSVAAIAGIAGVIGAYLVRKATGGTIVALIGGILLLGFVVMRAASFNHFDYWINIELAGLKMNWIMEISGIAIVCCGALWRLRNHA